MRATVLALRSQPAHPSSVEPNAVKVALGGVFGAGKEVSPEAGVIDMQEVDIKIISGDLGGCRSIPGDPVKLFPAITLACPGERLAVWSPVKIVVHDNPRWVLFGKNGSYLAVSSVSNHCHFGVLCSVQLLNDELGRIVGPGPIHSGQVMFSRISGNLNPSGF